MYFDVTNINLNWKQICITHPFNGRGSKLGRKLGGRFSKKQCVIWKSSFLSPYVLNQQLQAYHPASTTLLCLYMQSNKIHKVFQWVSLFSTYVSSTCFGSHRSIIRSVLQAVFADLVCGNTHTTRHVQPLRLDVSSSTVRSETCRANISAE